MNTFAVAYVLRDLDLAKKPVLLLYRIRARTERAAARQARAMLLKDSISGTYSIISNSAILKV